MKSAVFTFLVCFYATAAIPLFAQTSLSGIINSYAAVTAYDRCLNRMTVDDAQNFSVGQRVMIMQMKGAAISLANNATYGDVSSYQSSGNYEINTIKTIAGNVIEFEYAVLRTYDVAGAVQIISLEGYTSAVVSAPVRAKAWDGASGGVVLLKADTLILNDSISVTGLGFRGGLLENDMASNPCVNGSVGGATEYFCTTISCGAAKGEGLGTAHGYGRGKNACGAGGGNDHNTGGGGGGNFGAGGKGGTRTNTSNFNCPGPAPGEGGLALTYSNTDNKVFMGGGGGAGDENNSRGTGGANGGGIVIIMADVLNGNNRFIKANGNNVKLKAGSDGAGGGGGGGAVLLYVNTLNGTLRVDANGGNGGILDNDGVVSPNAHCMGPGGGGGGGMLWVKGASISANITLIDTGGINGRNVFGLAVPACPIGTTNGATRGNDGGSLTGLNIPEANNPYIPLTATACCDDTVCPGELVNFQSTATGTAQLSYDWGNGNTSANFSENVMQTQSYILTVTDGLGCQLTRTVTITVSNNASALSVCCDTTVCQGAVVNLNAFSQASGNLTYAWSTGQSTSSIQLQVNFSQTISVSVTDSTGCVSVASANVSIGNVPPNVSICCDTSVCSGASVLLNVTGQPGEVYTYEWNSGQTTSSVQQQVGFSQSFAVTVTDASGCQVVRVVNISVPFIQTAVSVVPDSAILLGQTVQLSAIGDTNYSFNWSPADDLDNPGSQNPVAIPGANTQYCVTVTNAINCTASACADVELVVPDIKIPDAFSPNGDGVNDVLELFPLKYATIYLIRVFNRWGELVYEANSNIPWNGTFKSKAQPAGAYTLLIEYGSPLTDEKRIRTVKDIVLVR